MKKRIGLVVHNMHEEYSVELIKGVERFCNEQNFQLQIFPINARYSENYGFEYRNRAITKLINQHNLDGVIYSASALCCFEEKIELNKELDEAGPIPIVNIGLDIANYSFVNSNSKNAFQNMISHLIEIHHKKNFLLFTSYDTNQDSKNRKDWFLEILQNHNIEIPAKNIINAEYNRFRASEQLINYIQKYGVDFEAIVCLNDTMAFGIIKGLNELGLLVPDDILVTGFDNTKKAVYSIPPLTTINPDLAEQAYQAGLILLEQMKEFEKNPEHFAEFQQKPESKKSKIIESKERFRCSCGCVEKNDLYTDYINKEGIAKKFSTEELYKIFHSENLSTNNELYILHHLTQASLTVFTIDELFALLPHYIKISTLEGLAIFTYDKPHLYKSSKSDFKIPHHVKRIFSYEPNIDLKPNLVKECFNPHETAIPKNTFKKEYRKLAILPIFEGNWQYGYIVAPLGNRDYLFYQTLFEVFSKEITNAINLTNVQNTNSLLETKNSKLKKHSSKLGTLSKTDELTAIYNRRGFISQSSKMIKKTVSKNNSGLIIFCDMDGLKKINDTYGHEAGDRAILAETKILQKVIRSTDILGRIGGDEFAIAAEGASMEFFHTFIRRVEEESKKLNDSRKEKFNISISAGATIFSSEETNLETLLDKADKELYKEKKKKKKN